MFRDKYFHFKDSLFVASILRAIESNIPAIKVKRIDVDVKIVREWLIGEFHRADFL